MFSRFLARQLACPTGVFGRWVLGPLWNRRNAVLNDAAFAALAPEPADRVLDVGFGGGYLLERLFAIRRHQAWSHFSGRRARQSSLPCTAADGGA